MIDYKELGFKSGLEIHQQLDSRKLFCNCPSILRVDEPSFEVRRKLHVVAGESGEVDVAALREAYLDKEFIYQGYDTTCLVELDEEPPRELNREALMTALQIALHLNCTIIPISQIMRKIVIDGSNTSGFQRTVLIGRDGFVETSLGRVGIETIFLEEDSARPVERDEKKVIYRLDRLGIPLVEIATAAEIKNAEHAKETALKIGEILRACKVKRGIGTIRQDINISIRGSNRVELKGFQDPKIMIQTVETEVLRQKKFLDEGKINPAEVRNVLENAESVFLRPISDSARMYPETDLPILKISKSLIDEAKKNLPKLREEIEKELKKQGLNEEYIQLLFKQNKVEDYKQAYYALPRANLIGELITVFPKELASRKSKNSWDINEIVDDNLGDILDLVNKKKISEKDIKTVLENLVDGKNLEEAIKIEKADISNVEEEIHKLIKSKPGLSANAYMGLVMKEFKGKVDGKEAMEIIKKFTK